MPDIKYPAVPAPEHSLASVHRTAVALYQGYNALVGVPTVSDLQVCNKGELDDKFAIINRRLDDMEAAYIALEARVTAHGG